MQTPRMCSSALVVHSASSIAYTVCGGPARWLLDRMVNDAVTELVVALCLGT